MLFFAYCKETGCVVIRSTMNPAQVFNLIPDFDEHFAIIEVEGTINDYTNKLVKVQDGQPVIVGPMTEQGLVDLCGNCPYPVQ